MTFPFPIELARPDDLVAAQALLRVSRLPPDGLEACLETLVVARDRGALAGTAALEVYGEDVLLRSVCVALPYRGRGLGWALTDAALALARQRAARRAYLLTETAQPFFRRYGFHPIERARVAPAVRSSIEFTAACPSTAQAMVFDLGDQGSEDQGSGRTLRSGQAPPDL